MIKINKIIALSLSLVLAPLGALRADGADTANRLVRGIVFQASRFVAGALANRALQEVEFVSHSNDISGKISRFIKLPDTHSKLKSEFIPTFALFAMAGLAPQGLNRLTDSFLPGALSWFAPSSSLSKGEKDKAGRFAFWAGMAASPLVDIAMSCRKSFKR